MKYLSPDFYESFKCVGENVHLPAVRVDEIFSLMKKQKRNMIL